MADDQIRGRRRPSREYHRTHSSRPSTYRLRESDRSSEEPVPKHFKREPTGLENISQSSNRIELKYDHNNKSPPHSSEPSSSKGCGKFQNRTDSLKEKYDIIQTRPTDIQTKKGLSGDCINLEANYFRLLTTPTWRIHQYNVSFSPEVELRRVRGGLLSQHRNLLGGYLYDGSKLFTSIKLKQNTTILTTKCQRGGDDYTITLNYGNFVSMSDWESLQILNLILRRAMEGLKMQLVGRNFFDAIAKIDLREFKLQLWPGYQTSIRQHEQNILLCADVAHKVMRTETVYDILRSCTQQGTDYQEQFRRAVLGLTILTDYNNKTYRINDVDFALNPKKTFETKDKEISFIDYYYQKYNIRIRDPEQPLLLTKSKDRGKVNEMVLLIPELCRPTGLTDNMRNNFQLMRAMADHTRMNPDRRIDRLKIFNRRLRETSDSLGVLKNWNMELDTRLIQIEGRVLKSQRIWFSDQKAVSAGDQADWTRMFRGNGMYTTSSRGLDRWAVIGTNRNSRDLRNFVESLIRAAGGMKMRINRPRELLLYDDRNSSYIQAMDDCSQNDPQLILCLVPNNNSERYASIKKKGCLERSVPTQVITQKTASNNRGLMSIATKVAIQINCKLGYTPWMVEVPLPGLMTIGYDVAKSSRDRNKAFGALVSTMDMQVNSTFYSTVAECSSFDVLSNNLWPMITKALRQYQTEHENKLPNRILFYRDGVGEGSLRHLYEHEVKVIVSKLEDTYKRAQCEKSPMFAYVLVTKSMNTRFFAGGRNPPPGTVVDDIVTLPERYDFYLVSQSVRQGTVSPTSYNVLYSNIRLSPDHMQLLTYKMTHLYYNWSGTTRVPAVCQYAKKLATLVATSLHQPPLNLLEKKLYYL